MKNITLLIMILILAFNVSNSFSATVLTTGERDGLISMREEEKLARDVYLDLYDKWHLQIFNNIAASEQIHMDKILGLLNAYNIPDPVAGKSVGDFSNPIFKDLYYKLTNDGSSSLMDALKVGVFIEKTDIDDLTDLIAKTDKKNIRNVYTNLRSGSYNHLNAFEYQLSIR